MPIVAIKHEELFTKDKFKNLKNKKTLSKHLGFKRIEEMTY